jgi:hypothetical protein
VSLPCSSHGSRGRIRLESAAGITTADVEATAQPTFAVVDDAAAQVLFKIPFHNKVETLHLEDSVFFAS